MSIEVTIETTVAAPIEAVYDALIDVDAWPTWLIATGIVAVRRAAGGTAPVAGEALTIDQRAAGRASVVEAVVETADRPRTVVIAGRDAEGVRTRLEAILAAADDGATALRWSVRIDLPFRYRIFESMAAPQVQRAAALDVEAFRRRLASATTD